MEHAQGRWLELFHHLAHRHASKKRTAMALAIAQHLEEEGHFPQANYAFDNGLLNLDLTRVLERAGTHWGSEVACARPIQWYGQWQRVDTVAATLRPEHPESCRPVTVRGRNGKDKQYWVFTKVVRLQRYGRKRLVMVHDTAALSEVPRFLLTDAQHWESGRVIETWSYRWAAEICHEFAKQVPGLEAAQVRKEAAVTRHFRLRCVAQSLVQRTPASGAETERLAFAQGHETVGQRVRTIARDAFHGLLRLVARLFAHGRSCEPILEVLMPT